MKKFTKELGPGWITLVENDDYALSRLIFGDGLEVDCDEEETPLLKKGFQQIQEYCDADRNNDVGQAFSNRVANLAAYVEHFVNSSANICISHNRAQHGSSTHCTSSTYSHLEVLHRGAFLQAVFHIHFELPPSFDYHRSRAFVN